ncbi:MAG TPA: ImmA/IrrE family metallo-endopeptidase [Phaeodactylibacter sp.]|nr:ImmA/IrrE family metallo-endopeptidase [Phaeodactylibacter sp.]
MNDLQAKRQLLSCPGDTIQETIDVIGMSQAELAVRLGRSVPKLNELIKGKAPISKETATKLEYVLGIPANFWLELEREYQNELHQLKQMELLEQRKEWLKSFPLREMKKMKILPDTRDIVTLVRELLRFFRVGSPLQWEQIYKEQSLAFKIALKYTSEPQAISVWLRMGEIQAEKMTISGFDKKKLRKSIIEIKNICYLSESDWMKQLQNVFAECGVALVYTPGISKAPIYGATRWIKNNSLPLIQITDRHKDYNSFWFTLYHELAHILYHGKRDIFIEGLKDIEQDTNKEKEADIFAARMLLTQKQLDFITGFPSYNTSLIKEISDKLKIHQSIIVSQLQREKIISYKDRELNSLKKKVVFEDLTL